jgi:hypothetical protein
MSPNPLSDRLEHLTQAIAERVVNLVVEAIDVEALLSRVDINALISRVDVNAVVAGVNVDDVVARVDVEALLSRVDVEGIVDRIDVNALVERVNVNQLMKQVDIDALVKETELGSIIARSTTGVMTEVLDVIRAQGVGIDDFLARWTNRLLRRPPGALPLGPRLLLGPPGGAIGPAAPPALARGAS